MRPLHHTDHGDGAGATATVLMFGRLLQKVWNPETTGTLFGIKDATVACPSLNTRLHAGLSQIRRPRRNSRRTCSMSVAKPSVVCFWSPPTGCCGSVVCCETVILSKMSPAFAKSAQHA